MRLTKEQAIRPMHDLLRLLPQLAMDNDGNLTPGANDPPLLAKVAESANDVAGCMHRGVSAIGCLLAHSAPEVEDGTVGSENVEALGWLLAELGDFGATCFILASQCRRASKPL